MRTITKADLLRILEKVPMNTPIVMDATGREMTPTKAWTVTGRDGLCLVLTDGSTPSDYVDAEEIW